MTSPAIPAVVGDIARGKICKRMQQHVHDAMGLLLVVASGCRELGLMVAVCACTDEPTVIGRVGCIGDLLRQSLRQLPPCQGTPIATLKRHTNATILQRSNNGCSCREGVDQTPKMELHYCRHRFRVSPVHNSMKIVFCAGYTQRVTQRNPYSAHSNGLSKLEWVRAGSKGT